MFTLTFVDLENESSISICAIWEDELSKIIFLPSFQLFTRLNSHNRNETSLLMNSDILLYMNISISNWHNSSFDSTKMKFFTLFQFLTRLLTSTTLISLIHNSLGKTEWCEKRAFQLLKMRKMKVSWNKKPSAKQTFYWQLGLRVWRILLVITW